VLNAPEIPLVTYWCQNDTNKLKLGEHDTIISMSNSHKNTVRITARIAVSIQETLERAAELSGATLNQFMIQAALKEAKKIIEDERVIILSQNDADTVFSLIENPPVPNAKLKAALKKHKEFFSESH
jgi:uncharacterized protein (DUF1778 family)